MLSRLSIRWRLTACYALSVAVLLGGLAVASYFAMRASMYRSIDVDLRYRMAGLQDELLETQASSVHDLADEVSRTSSLGVLFQILDDKGALVYQTPVLTQHGVQPLPLSPLGNGIVYRNAGNGRWPVRFAAKNIILLGQAVVVEVAQPLRFHFASLREFADWLMISIPVLVVLAGFLGYWLSSRALAPVDQIVEDARAVDSSRLSRRLTVPAAQDELHRLSETLNAMLDRIELSVNRIKQFTADASHELRAPVTLIQAAAEYSLRRERSREELTEAMEKILQESQRTSQLIDNLLLLARADSEEVIRLGQVPVDSVLREAADRVRPLATSKNISITAEVDDSAVVRADATLLQRLFFVLLENAVKYTPGNGTVRVSLRTSPEQVIVEIMDSGIGISPDDLPHIFDRFWRADKVRSREMGGTGLGLSIAKWIAEKNGGTIQVESTVGQGSKFQVRLPRLAGIAAPITTPAHSNS